MIPQKSPFAVSSMPSSLPPVAISQTPKNARQIQKNVRFVGNVRSAAHTKTATKIIDKFCSTVAVPELVHLIAFKYAYWDSTNPRNENSTI